MKRRFLLTAAMIVASAIAVPATAVQNVPAHRSVNSLGVWFWSVHSADHAVAVCQVNTPVGQTCWYRGYW